MRAIMLLSALAVAGCASNPSIESLSPEQRGRVAAMAEYQSDSVPTGLTYRTLGAVKGLACKRNLYASGKPSIEEAHQGVRIQAALLGANAVMNVVCEDKQETDFAHNCWQTVVCIGDAIVTSARP